MHPSEFITCLCLLFASQAVAAPRNSANYTLPSEVSAAGGGRSSSANYSVDAVTGSPGGTTTATGLLVKSGYAGQLYDITGLSLAATPATLDEGGSRQLAASAVLDDASVLALAPATILWSVSGGPLAGIDGGGLATADAVSQDSAASVQGHWNGFVATLGLSILDTILDNYGCYAADGLPDDWQVLHFGSNNPNAAPDKDADGTGQSNLFKYVAGLDPVDPSSVFKLAVDLVPNQPFQKRIVFSPVVAGRTYTVQVWTALSGWSVLSGSPQSDIGTQRTVTDPNTSAPSKLYRVLITKP